MRLSFSIAEASPLHAITLLTNYSNTRRLYAEMPVQFSCHALEKMRKRNVKPSEVYATINSPDEVYEDVEHGTIVVVKRVNTKSVIVAYKMRQT